MLKMLYDFGFETFQFFWPITLKIIKGKSILNKVVILAVVVAAASVLRIMIIAD